MMLVRVLVGLAGAILVILTFRSTIRTFVLPRSARDGLARFMFMIIRLVLSPATSPRRPYLARDKALALFAPVTLLTLLAFWLALVLTGYTAIYWAIGVGSWEACVLFSGSSLTTLGFVAAKTLPQAAFAVSEAITGLILVALLIAYLPTIYAAFSRREVTVAMLMARAGDPPSAIEMVLRYRRLERLERIDELWPVWETWFAELQETHTSLASLAFFRSPQPSHSWITAAGTVLDAAALRASTLDLPREPEAELCLRAGFLALRQIADFFTVPYNPNPEPTDPISVARSEFDEAYDRMRDAGVPLKERDKAWRGYAGWRVNYDVPLVAIARIVIAPPAPWVSDRSLFLRRRTRPSLRKVIEAKLHSTEGLEDAKTIP